MPATRGCRHDNRRPTVAASRRACRALLETLEGRSMLASAPVGLDGITRFDQLPYLASDRLAGGQSSYERNGGNRDWGNFVRINGNGDHIILDERGPGIVDRLWFTRVTDAARIKMWFDGELTPRVDTRLVDLVGGRDPRFPAPLVAGPRSSSGGFLSYLPMPYATSVQMALTGGDDLYYNVGFQTFAPGTAITTWTGSESSTAARDVWNQVGEDPKPTAGNTTLSGTVNVPAGGAASVVNISGQGARSIASIKLKVPGIAVAARESVTDDGRAHAGSSSFTLKMSGGTASVSLVRRLDFGIANQRAAVYVDNVYAGEWFDAGNNTADQWKDSTFALPVSLTSGKQTARIRVEFISSAIDWNEFRYQTISGGAVLDTLDVGNAASESAHTYAIVQPRWSGVRTFTYPAGNAALPSTDAGVAHRGSSRFTIALDPTNRGAQLVRRLDHGVADQRAGVFVNGVYAGDWFDAGTDTTDRWRTSTFYMPESLVGGRSSVNIEIRFVSAGAGGGYPAAAWNEFRYDVRSITSDGEVLTDRLEIGDAASQTAHAYQVTNTVWTGTQSHTSLHPAADARQILNGTRLRIYWDGDATPAVDAPLGSFFAMGEFGPAEVRSLPLGIGEDGQLYCYFPMPFRRGARIELVNDRGVALDGVRYEVQHAAFTGSFADVGYFKTAFNSHLPTVLDQDISILDASGAGRFLGVTQSIAGQPGQPASRWYLEGDERIYVDGSRTPAIHGTGTEDFYDGAWYFEHGPFTNPLSGNPVHLVEPAGTAGLSSDLTSAYRLFLHNAVPFRDGIHVSIEHGAVNEEVPDVWTLAYYYHSPQSRAVLTDVLDVGNTTAADPSSEQAHAYTIATQTWTGTRTYTFEGDHDDVQVSDDGRAHKGSSEFNLKLNPANTGMLLRRQLDALIGDSRANVYVDGALVGNWYRAGTNASHRWADDDFLIPAAFTAGKSQVRVKIAFQSASIDWNEFGYRAYSLVAGDGTAPTVANAIFERATRHQAVLNFSEGLHALPAAGDLVVRNVSTGAALPVAAFTVTAPTATQLQIRFNSMLADGNYRLTLKAGTVGDAAGNTLSADHHLDFFVLAGDANGDRTVDFADLVILAQNYNTSGRTFLQGNFNYSVDGKVDFNDLVILAGRYNTVLAAPALAASAKTTLKSRPSIASGLF